MALRQIAQRPRGWQDADLAAVDVRHANVVPRRIAKIAGFNPLARDILAPVLKTQKVQGDEILELRRRRSSTRPIPQIKLLLFLDGLDAGRAKRRQVVQQ
jgi:hypothetical protein